MGLVNDRSSSSQPADDSRKPSRMLSARKSAYCARDRCTVDLVDEVAEHGRDLRPRDSEKPVSLRTEVCREVLLAAARGAKLCVVLRAHAFEKVKAVCLPGRDTGDQRRAEDPIREQRGAGQRMRPAARVTRHVRSFRTKVIEDRLGVGGDMGDAPAGQPRRRAVAGPAPAHDPHAAAARSLGVRPEPEARGGRSGVEDQWHAATRLWRVVVPGVEESPIREAEAGGGRGLHAREDRVGDHARPVTPAGRCRTSRCRSCGGPLPRSRSGRSGAAPRSPGRSVTGTGS